MNAFLLGGLVTGGLIVAAYLWLSAYHKQSPVLAQAIELVVACIGGAGGVKICLYVFSGKLSAALRSSAGLVSEEDTIYFLIGGFALIWISFETVARRLWLLYQHHPGALSLGPSPNASQTEGDPAHPNPTAPAPNE